MATIDDVAKKAKVSRMTVSRVINNSGYVKEETRLRINQAIDELKFKPNMIAKSLVTRKSRTVAYVMVNISDTFHNLVNKGFEAVAFENGYTTLMCNAHSASRVTDYINMLQSNATRLDAINQTIKKYNQALVYCNQDSKDLAIIQLKKVLSLNPKFIRAHQLLALLYMDSEQWDRAERELHKCMDIDRNNTLTLRYLKEVETQLTPDENSKQTGRRKKDDAVRYQSDNEIIIQPLNVKEQKSAGISSLINIAIGLVIGLAVMYFLVVPAAVSNANNEAQKTITDIGNQLDTKTSRIQELETQMEALQTENDTLNQELQGYVGADGTLQTIDSLLAAATTYLETQDITQTAANLETISASVNVDDTSEAFQKLYKTLLGLIGPQLSAQYYETGYNAYRSEDYATAIENLSKAVIYDETNKDAWLSLGNSYRKSDDAQNAITTYDKIIELFPETETARSAQRYRSQLAENTAQ